MNGKRKKLCNVDLWIEVENNRAYIFTSEDALDPYEIIEKGDRDCSVCNNSGWLDSEDGLGHECATCDGTGIVKVEK